MKNKFKLIGIIIYVLIIAIAALNIKNLSVEQLISYSPKNIFLAALFVLVMYILKSLSVFFPIVALQILSGFLFSAPLALTVNILGTLLCYTLPYLIGKFLGASSIENIIGKNEKILNIIDRQRSHKFFLPFFLRVVSCLPCDLVSLYLGALKIPYIYYISAGILGTLPGIIPATFIGKSITNPLSSEFIISTSVTVFCSLVSVLIFYMYNQKHSK